MSTSFSTQRLDHLGIIAGICSRIELVNTIDRYLGDTQRKVSVGQATLAMILNALGFTRRPLYLTPEFFHNKPVEILLSPGLDAEDFNDDSLGRALDLLYDHNLTTIFSLVASNALRSFSLHPVAGHLDSTSFSFTGQFEQDSQDTSPIQITHGYSKDKRPDLKQAVVTLICAYKTQIPLWFRALSGNSNDQRSFPDSVEAFIGQLQLQEAKPPFVVIADSALYSKESLSRLSKQIDFITRVPATLAEVKALYRQAELTKMTLCKSDPRYHYQWYSSDYAGIKQRWLLVHSQPAWEQAKKTLSKQRQQEEEKARQGLARHAKKHFNCEEDALSSLQALSKTWLYHRLSEVTIQNHKSYQKVGRPTKKDTPNLKYSVTAKIEVAEEVIEQALSQQGYFILGTNVLEEERLSAEQMLKDYKEQGSSVERGFRFLKDPMFFAHGLYLKTPSRIMAMLMVMTLCLLVYALGEHQLRHQLEEQKESLPDQKGKPTQQITMRRVFQLFEGIDVLSREEAGHISRQLMNLKDIHTKILQLLGPHCQNYYFHPT